MSKPATGSRFVTNDSRENMVKAFKAQGCAECGVRYPDVDWGDLHVAHRHKDERTPLRFRLVRCGVEVIMAELLKCRCLCASCHAREHATAQPISEDQLLLFNGTGKAWHPA